MSSTRTHLGASREAPAVVATRSDPVEFAWRVHDGIAAWTARVDTKASIALAIEAAVLGFVVALATGAGEMAHPKGLSSYLLALGTGALIVSVTLSVLVVFPQLRARKTRQEYHSNFVYFGHLRHWKPADLEKRLAEDPIPLAQLSLQLVNTSKIAWRKHVWLQWSLSLFIVGVLVLAAALVAERADARAATNGPSPSPSITFTP